MTPRPGTPQGGRVIQGGSWVAAVVSFLHAAYPNHGHVVYRGDHLGFRTFRNARETVR